MSNNSVNTGRPNEPFCVQKTWFTEVDLQLQERLEPRGVVLRSHHRRYKSAAATPQVGISLARVDFPVS